MLKEVLLTLYQRDLQKLHTEISLYKSEENLWKISGDITNSGGNLALHLIGNLNTFIGGEIGKTGYVRDRPLEFSAKNVPIKTILDQINDTKHEVLRSINLFDEATLGQPYPGDKFEYKSNYAYLLTHLALHLAYHLGQINYHRRMLDVE